MEIKKMKELTSEEKKSLLAHWFRYYGKKIFTLEELMIFMEMVEQKVDAMFELAAMLYINGDGSTPVLDAIRSKDSSNLEKIMNKCRKLSKKDHNENIRLFVEEIITTFNHPEEAKPIDQKSFDKQLKEIIHNEENPSILNINLDLDQEDVLRTLKDCMFKDSEIKDEAPTAEFTYVEGIARSFVFCTERLRANKDKIAKLVDNLQIGDIPESFVNLCVTKNGHMWTGDQGMMEVLMALGIACGLIEYAQPREKWNELFGAVPTVIRTKGKKRGVIKGEKPEEFAKYIKEEDKKIQEEQRKYREEINAQAKSTFNEHYAKAAKVLENFGYSMGMDEDFYYLYDNKGEKLCEMSVEPILGGFLYEGVVNDTRVSYTYTIDGKNSDEGLIYRDIVTVDNLKKCDETYYGKQIKVELGVGLHEVSGVPRIEVTIIDPESDEKITTFSTNPFDLYLNIQNNFGPYGNYEDGTERSVNYTNVTKTPFVNSGALYLYENQEQGDSFSISINRDDYPTIYKVNQSFSKHADKDKSWEKEFTFNGQKKANELACKYLKTSRVKNLYHHILEHLEEEVPGMKNYIYENYPFIKEVEGIIEQAPNKEEEQLIRDFSIRAANVASESGKKVKKELK